MEGVQTFILVYFLGTLVYLLVIGPSSILFKLFRVQGLAVKG